MKSSALRKPIVTLAEIQGILAMKDTAKSIKERLEILQDTIKNQERDVISKLDQGADVQAAGHLISVSETSKRFPKWKAVFIDACGLEAADEVLDATEPTTYRNLIIKAA